MQSVCFKLKIQHIKLHQQPSTQVYTMARIDRLVQTIHQNNVAQAQMHPGKPVMLRVGAALKPLSNRLLTRDQIAQLIQEIAPQEGPEFLPGHRLEFEYQSEAGAIQIIADWSNLNLVVELNLLPQDRHDGPEALSESLFEQSVGLNSPSFGQEPVSSPSVVSIPKQTMPPTLPPAPAPSIAMPQPQPAAQAVAVKLQEPAPSPAPAPVQAPASAQVQVEAPSRQHPYVGERKPAEINKYLNLMFQEGCSDLHLSSLNPPLYRKDGDIVHLHGLPRMMPEQVEALIYPIMPDRNYVEFQERWDTDFAHEIPGVGRFRVNCFMDRMGPGAVMRIIPSDILTAEELNLPKSVLDLCWLNKGLVVVTGPTGSGKSTTLAAIIDYINRNRAAHIITIEDPIEFVHPNKKCLLNQREVGLHTKSFKNALRAALREDPDIVLVGEMRDLETIAIAMETAETGHLVFGTLHTNTAPSTVDRIIDQFPADRQAQIRTMLSESLKAVIAQTLCKKTQGGRIAALEILLCNHAMSNLIREGKTFQIASMMSTSKGMGMITLNDSLLELVQKRTVTAEEAYIKAIDKTGFKSMLDRANIRLNLPTA